MKLTLCKEELEDDYYLEWNGAKYHKPYLWYPFIHYTQIDPPTSLDVKLEQTTIIRFNEYYILISRLDPEPLEYKRLLHSQNVGVACEHAKSQS